MIIRDFNELFIHLHPADSVAIARVDVAADTRLRLVDGDILDLLDTIPAGHKLALRPVAVGESLLRYGQPIGVVHSAIRAGEHVHTHNLGPGEMALMAITSRDTVELEELVLG